MKASDFIDTIERFFLDIIGTVVPGMALILGCCYITETNAIKLAAQIIGSSDYAWMVLVGSAYVTGHGITSFGFQIVVKWLEGIAAWKIGSWNFGSSLFRFVVPEAKIEEKLYQDPIFLAFRSSVTNRMPAMREAASKGASLRVWRNLAIGLVQKESQIIYRFTFISLLNLGMASALVLLVIAWLFLLGLKRLDPTLPTRDFNLALPIALLAFLLFIERFYQFNRRTLQIPFSMALVRLELSEDDNGAASESPSKTGEGHKGIESPLVVYLAGGFKSGWQAVVRARVPTVRFLDPSLHQLERCEEYTAWDLEAIRRCDCVFANLEATNPGGYSLALEVGYAKALGKFVMLIDGKSSTSDDVARHLGMLRQSSDVVFTHLEEGIRFLDKYQSPL